MRSCFIYLYRIVLFNSAMKLSVKLSESFSETFTILKTMKLVNAVKRLIGFWRETADAARRAPWRASSEYYASPSPGTLALTRHGFSPQPTHPKNRCQEKREKRERR